jgi:hypothetical protein
MNAAPALQILECRLSLILLHLTQSPLSQRHLREEIRTDKLGSRQRLSPMKLIVLG